MSLFNYSTTTYENLFATFLLFFNHANVLCVLPGDASSLARRNDSRSTVYRMKNQRHKFKADWSIFQ